MVKQTQFHVVYIRTTNDVNGNPRAAWLVRLGATSFVVREDYSGRTGLLKALEAIAEQDQSLKELLADDRAGYSWETGPVRVQPAEFKRLCKHYSA